jgi:PadR family transcriptional regulator PadR
MATPQKNDILQGTLVLLVLKTLSSQGPMHGYAMTTHIQRISADLLRIEEGSLYPALHRMEQLGWLRSGWGVTEKNREARYGISASDAMTLSSVIAIVLAVAGRAALVPATRAALVEPMRVLREE